MTAADKDASLQPLLDRLGPRIEAELRRAFEGRDLPHYDLMRYHLGWQNGDGEGALRGKLVRPLLCLCACEAVGGDVETALPLAAALELLHNFSLIHDDIEDKSSQRHGRDTLWRAFDVPLAVNAGDGMFALAHVSLHRLLEAGVDARRFAAVSRLLDTASLRLCEGQYLDLDLEKRLDVTAGDYLTMISGKTAALIAASAASGALVGEASPAVVSAFERFGEKLGLAFQVRDDLLGIWGESRATGKPTGDDVRARKKSFPVVYALENASPSDRAALRAIYAKETLTDDDVARAIAILERCNARARAQEAAERFAADGLRLLDAIDLVPARRRDLQRLAHYFVNRET
ncbi:MAG: polyprenyl synthetase family protein [Dehalococcoidia bacterium]|jgi:geranylgeranyl diphosphate synthase type I